MIHHKNPVEESFIMWIIMNPDSFHHLDPISRKNTNIQYRTIQKFVCIVLNVG